MKTAAEYRAMADECFKWAREAQATEVQASLRALAQVWLDSASKLDGPLSTAPAPVPERPSKTASGNNGIQPIEPKMP